jgi:hypothetical protein
MHVSHARSRFSGHGLVLAEAARVSKARDAAQGPRPRAALSAVRRGGRRPPRRSGDLGGCSLAFGGCAADDVDVMSDRSRGHCLAGMSCYGPVADVTAEVAADAGAVVTIHVPFSSQSHGSPVATLDPSTLVTLLWQLTSPGAACAADLTIKNVAFY